MSCGRSQTSPQTEDSGSKPSSADDDKPDDSAPVSGAYLTCLAPEPTPDMDYMVAGCQLRDGQNRHVATKQGNTRWAFAPAEGKTGPDIEVYDLYDKVDHYFDAMFVMRFNKAAGLTEVNRLAAVDYFLSSVPVLAPNSILLSSTKKSGLKLAAGGEEEPTPQPADPAKPEPMTFRRHNTAVDSENTIPSVPVAGIRQRPYVIPQVTEVNFQPVLPTTDSKTAVAQPILTQTQQANQQQALQNQLTTQMFSTLLSGVGSAIASGAAQPAQTGVVSGPPPAAPGGCTCQGGG